MNRHYSRKANVQCLKMAIIVITVIIIRWSSSSGTTVPLKPINFLAFTPFIQNWKQERGMFFSFFEHPQTNAWEVSITCELLRWHILSSPLSRPVSVRQSSTQRRCTQTLRGARQRCTWRGRSSPRWGGGGSGGETRSLGNSHWLASLLEGRGIRSPVKVIISSLSRIQVRKVLVALVTWINI